MTFGGFHYNDPRQIYAEFRCPACANRGYTRVPLVSPRLERGGESHTYAMQSSNDPCRGFGKADAQIVDDKQRTHGKEGLICKANVEAFSCPRLRRRLFEHCTTCEVSGGSTVSGRSPLFIRRAMENVCSALGNLIEYGSVGFCASPLTTPPSFRQFLGRQPEARNGRFDGAFE